MSAFEFWCDHITLDYEITIYMSRDCDGTYLESGEFKPGKLISFQMGFTKLYRGKSIKDFYCYNPLVAGEWLRDEIGYGPAKDALISMDIPKDVPVWKLGNKG